MGERSIRVMRLYLGHLDNGPVVPVLPLNGYAIQSGSDVVMVDTGIGDAAVGVMQSFAPDWRMTCRTVDEALADHGLEVGDVTYLVSTHLHLDHFGQHAALKGTPFVVQRSELARARRETDVLGEFFEFSGAVINEVDGDDDLVPGVRILHTPGHTIGHQSLLVTHGDGSTDLLVGDAAYTAAVWEDPSVLGPGHPAHHMQVGEPAHFEDTLARLRELKATRVHFCHDPVILAG